MCRQRRLGGGERREVVRLDLWEVGVKVQVFVHEKHERSVQANKGPLGGKVS